MMNLFTKKSSDYVGKESLEKYTSPMCNHINIGSGVELSIKELAIKIKEVINYKGELEFDSSKPDGTLRKLLDSSKDEDSFKTPQEGIP